MSDQGSPATPRTEAGAELRQKIAMSGGAWIGFEEDIADVEREAMAYEPVEDAAYIRGTEYGYATGGNIPAREDAAAPGLREALTTLATFEPERHYDGGALVAWVNDVARKALAAAPAAATDARPAAIDVERLHLAIRAAWESGHSDLRSGLTTGTQHGPEGRLAAVVAREYEARR